MNSPFDELASQYRVLWSDTPEGLAQRLEVWTVIDRLFSKGQNILDLGCGTGDDALHLMEAGIAVLGIDSSLPMVRVAQARGVLAGHLAIEALQNLSGEFDGALSNFGALNCVAALDLVARQLGRLVRPGGSLAVCLFTRFSFRETASSLRRCEWRKAARRWTGYTRWRGMDIYYPTARRIQRSFDPWFRPCRQYPIGAGDHRLFVFERRRPC